VRAEPFAKGIMKGRGGLCWLRGRPFVVMDEQLSQADRVALVATALASFDLESLHVIPAVREVVEGHAPGATRKPRRVSRPGLARATRRATEPK